MNSILDFIRAAAPWVAMGLLVVILAVRGAAQKKKGRKQDGRFGFLYAGHRTHDRDRPAHAGP